MSCSYPCPWCVLSHASVNHVSCYVDDVDMCAWQELIFNGKPLMDPLSLEDCKGIQLGTDNSIKVQVSTGGVSANTAAHFLTDCQYRSAPPDRLSQVEVMPSMLASRLDTRLMTKVHHQTHIWSCIAPGWATEH